MQYNAEEGILDVDLAVVLDEGQLPEFVHEEIDPRRKAGLLARQTKNTATQVHPIQSQQFIARLPSQGAVLWPHGDSIARTATSSLRNSI